MNLSLELQTCLVLIVLPLVRWTVVQASVAEAEGDRGGSAGDGGPSVT